MTILTIIIPSYNNTSGFITSIDKLCKQTHYNKNDVCFIISDDSDNLEIFEYYQLVKCSFKNIAYFQGPQLGAVSNWNISMERSSSNYLMFLHHDEYVHSEYFLDMVLRILSTKDIDVLVLPLSKEKNGKFFKHYPNRLKWLFVRFPSLLFSCNAFGPPSVFVVRKNIYEKFESELSWLVDVEWYFRILVKRPKVKILNDTDFVIISNLNYGNSITKNLELKSVQPKEQQFIMNKHAISIFLFSMFFKILRLPVKILGCFNV